MNDNVVPLPAALNECACPYRPTRHLPSCPAAVAFDDSVTERFKEHPGKRHAGIGWDFLVRFSGAFRIEIAVDAAAIIMDRADEYRAFEPEDGYGEKPMEFIAKLICEQLDMGGVYFGARRSTDYSYMDELSDSGWTREDTERLHAALDAMPDPNQGTLNIDTGTGGA